MYSSKNKEPRGRDDDGDDDGESGKKARWKRKERGGGGEGGEVQETRTDVVMGEKIPEKYSPSNGQGANL